MIILELLQVKACLNRTFYGIEIGKRHKIEEDITRLNRTFYGIEILIFLLYVLLNQVLIVPFMELKSKTTAQK